MEQITRSNLNRENNNDENDLPIRNVTVGNPKRQETMSKHENRTEAPGGQTTGDLRRPIWKHYELIPERIKLTKKKHQIE